MPADDEDGTSRGSFLPCRAAWRQDAEMLGIPQVIMTERERNALVTRLNALVRCCLVFGGATAILASGESQAAGLAQQLPGSEYDVLVDFYNLTNGSEWNTSAGWLDPNAESWVGVTVEGVQTDTSGVVIKRGHVTSLYLPVNGLRGQIPARLEELKHLEVLNLGISDFYGTQIPSSLSNLPRMRILDLRYSSLSGPIPKELARLTRLEVLNISGNYWFSPIPLEFAELRSLRVLDISNGNVTGQLPPELGRLPHLQLLDLHSCRITGSIPKEWGNLTELRALTLLHNHLSGPIPNELGRLGNLVVLNLGDNLLTGEIPRALGDLRQLKSLALAGNLLEGVIPLALGNLQSAFEISVSGNQLTGPIPEQLGACSSLITLDVSSNQLAGSVPEKLGNLSALAGLYFSHNNLTGTIPSHFASPVAVWIDATRNNFDVSPDSAFEKAAEKLRSQGDQIADLPQNGPNRILNISGRAGVGSGEGSLVAGFILAGNQYNSVTVRGLGPSLAAAGVANPLQDPKVGLYNREGRLMFENYSWEIRQRPIYSSLEPTDPREAVIFENIELGAYTAVVGSNDGTTGVGLAEVYCVDSIFDSVLANVSIRGMVASDEVVVVGFIVGPIGSGHTEVVLRGLGPSLARSGIANPLQDPVLALHGSNGELLMRNDNWTDVPHSRLSETGLEPPDRQEAAFAVQLGPGPYTAVLRGSHGTSGVGLVEMYNLRP